MFRKKNLTRSSIISCYRALLKRDPENETLISDLISLNLSIEDLIGAIISSSEYHLGLSRSSGELNKKIIESCYKAILNREIEDDECMQQRINSGQSMQGLIAELISSPEFLQISERENRPTEQDIVDIFKLILGRYPEKNSVIEHFVNERMSWKQLLIEILSCHEFKKNTLNKFYTKAVEMYYGADVCPIEVSPDELSLQEMFSRIKYEWEILGDEDPYWSVLMIEDFRAHKLNSKNKVNFYNTAQDTKKVIKNFEQRASVSINYNKCVELGCGVGRVTFELNKIFDDVMGLDVSPGNLKIAQNLAKELNVINADFILIKSIDDFDSVPAFDFLYSVMVLQHNPPPVQKIILNKLFSKMKSGGGCLVQLVTEMSGYRFQSHEYLGSKPEDFEMHALPMHEVIELFELNNIPLKEIRADHFTGLYGSYSFFGAGKK
jgi:SAM-dependent methyltransferase